jgi:hypothetical protein
MESNTMVTPKNNIIANRQKVSNFSISVVNYCVKECHGTKPRVICCEERGEIYGIIDGDPLLRHTVAIRSVPQNCQWNNIKTQMLAN